MSKSSAAKFVSVPDALRRSIQATKVEFRQVGKSGLRVSSPILGGLQVGSSKWFPWVLNEKEVCNYISCTLALDDDETHIATVQKNNPAD